MLLTHYMPTGKPALHDLTQSYATNAKISSSFSKYGLTLPYSAVLSFFHRMEISVTPDPLLFAGEDLVPEPASEGAQAHEEAGRADPQGEVGRGRQPARRGRRGPRAARHVHGHRRRHVPPPSPRHGAAAHLERELGAREARAQLLCGEIDPRLPLRSQRNIEK